MPNIINNWPNANLHNLNEDWMLEQIKRLGIKIEQFNQFLPHVSDWNGGQWDIDHEYSMNEIVFNGNEIYIAIKNVPTDVNINDSSYWGLIGTDSYITTKVDKTGDTMTGNLDVQATLAANALTIHSNTPEVVYTNANGQQPDAEITFDLDNNERRFVFFQHQTEGGLYEEYVLPKATNLTQNKVYDIITSKERIQWDVAPTWSDAIANVKMDIVLVYDAVIDGLNIRFSIDIPMYEIDNTPRYHFSESAYTQSGTSYILATISAGSLSNMQLVTNGVSTGIGPSFILYR